MAEFREKIVYINKSSRKSSGPKIDPWGIPSFILLHLEVEPLNRTLWYLSDKKLSISFNKRPLMPLRLSLYNNPSCQSLPKAFEISRNTPRTSREGLQSKASYISWMIAISCWTHWSSGIKPDWCRERRLFSLKYLKKSLKMIRSNAFLQIGSKEIGLYFLRSCLSPFLWVGTMFAFFHWSGNIPVRGQFSNRSFNGFKIDLWNNFNILIEISSYRWALLASEDFGIFKIPDSFMLTERNNDVVIEDLFIGNLLRLFIKEHWFAKTSLKWFAFSLKLVTKWSFTSRSGIIGTFFQLVKDLRTLQ